MGYDIRAVLARAGIFEQAIVAEHPTIIISLEQGIEMLLNTDEFHDSFLSEEGSENPKRTHTQFVHLSDEIAAFCASLSQKGMVAYIEAEYFGGVGSQASIVWESGKVALKPSGNMWSEPSMTIGPINSALKLLGVRKTTSDEFQAVGLQRYRHLEDWEDEESN